MSRVIDFADGFTSATAPQIEGASQDDYTLLNNQSSATDVTGLVFNEADHVSAFGSFALIRSDSTPSYYNQTGTFIAFYDGADWNLEFGNFAGDSVLADSIASPFNVVLTITAAGQVRYQTGNMGSGHSCKFKLIDLRIVS